MIQVTFKNGGYCCWTIGENVTRTGEAVLIIANGKELEKIKSKFTNIPMCDDSTISWTGVFAAFIFDNFVSVPTIRTGGQK
jgi:hypothetical protein